MPVSTPISASYATNCRIKASLKNPQAATLREFIMSLLLDARKKSRGGSDSHSELALSLEPVTPASPETNSAPIEGARSAGQNLFKAKSNAAVGGKVNSPMKIILLGALILFSLGGAYVWYETSGYDRPVVQAAPRSAPVTTPAVAVVEPAKPAQPEVLAEAKSDMLVASIASPNDSALPVKATVPATKKSMSHAPSHQAASPAINIERDQPNSLNALLNNAYQAYRGGRFEQAHALYRDALSQDPRNTDALLGLAAIAQHLGADTLSAQYYGKVLSLDPRNAVANAGMSALSTDENRESHLKMLLNEQKDSSSLHFALGNFYANQTRWSEAQQSYFNAYKLEPNNANLAFNLAISLERLGQRKPASQYYQRAVQLDTGNGAGFDHAAIEQHAQRLAE
jgi:Tfp pilus assembly protein PilF